MLNNRFTYLLEQYLSETISFEERQELFQLLQEPDHIQALETVMNEEMKQRLFAMEPDARSATAIREHFTAVLDDSAAVNHSIALHDSGTLHNPSSSNDPSVLPAPIARVIPFWRRNWIKYAAAIIIVSSITAYFWTSNKKPQSPSVELAVKPDILPGSNKAILTLSNGKKVELNNTASETISDGSLSIANNNGQLSYSDPANPLRGGVAPGAENSSINPSGPGAGVGVPPNNATNTMTTPRGGQYQLTLSDGTKVWLNAASSITYPITFTSKTREVKITGEAYFEVAKNKEKPFIVKTATSSPFEKGGHDDAPNETPRGGFSITVLGTSFNINAYPDEPSAKTSLLEGSIKINSILLKPGQAYQNQKIITTNIDQDLAWKNGGFNFKDLTLKEVFRQLSRWYDIDIRYEGKIPNKEIGGEMGRNLNLSQILKVLDEVGIKTRLEGKTLTVLSEK